MEESQSPPVEDANHLPRLMISKIVCENFKSYAGIKELGPFHKARLLLCVYYKISVIHVC